MSALHEMQRSFQAYVLGEAAQTPPTVASDEVAAAATRMQIYAEGVRLRFLEVLSEDYPGVRALLGAEKFEALTAAYGASYPSDQRSIRWYGRWLARFLDETPAWRSVPETAEMARFEWRKGELLDAADAPAIGVADIAAVPPEHWAQMQPRPVPATRRLDLHWNTPEIWRSLEAGEPAGKRLRHTPAQPWLLWRNGITLHWRSIDLTEAWAFDAVADGASFGAICEGLGQRAGEQQAPILAATLLKQWAVDGVLAGV